MKTDSRLTLVVLLILGLLLVGRGTALWFQEDRSGAIQNWVAPSSMIPGNSLMLTWGVGGARFEEPDKWHFQVKFEANDTGEVRLLWNLNESVLFERSGSKFDATFEIVLPRVNGQWRWDWMISNPHSTVLSVANFTVYHYPVRYPERQNGVIVVCVGLIIGFTAAAFTFMRRGQIRLR